ncbi:MAG: hypothetical protein KC897_03650 [Candidatus Omnitrophica bacterium]|nr:hypothetical protein [Candidatus Omnitrophota bacterium]MCB9719485.1 hypothetical protein [Candidatus Omnitrophota bacterium]
MKSVDIRKHIILTLSLLITLPAVQSEITHAAETSRVGIDRGGRFGPLIAETPTYTVYSPDLEERNGQYYCPARYSTQPVLTPDERANSQQANWDYQKSHKPPIYAEWKALHDINQQHVRTLPSILRNISREEYQRIFDELIQEQKDLQAWQDAEYKRIEREADARMQGINPPLRIFIMHRPADPLATIIPLNGKYPTDTYQDELKAVVQPAFTHCPDLEMVVINHFYDAAVPPETTDDIIGRSIIHHTYMLRDGQLALRAQDNDRVPMLWFDPGQNTDLTWATYTAKKEDISRVKGEYRKDQYDAAKRQPGVVYKLDDYWSRYKNFEIGRRIFDGDFRNFTDTIDFRVTFSSFAELYSTRCKDLVEDFTHYQMPVRDIKSTTYYTDGTFDREYETNYIDFYIDSRFTPEWKIYLPDVQQYLMYQSAKAYNEMGGLESLTKSNFGEKMAAGISSYQQMEVIKFFGQHACESATLQQLSENYIRAANNRPSVQDEGIQLAGAHKESDPPGPVPVKYDNSGLMERRQTAALERAREEAAKAEEERRLREQPIPPKNTGAYEEFRRIQQERTDYLASKKPANMPHTISTRPQTGESQGMNPAADRYGQNPRQPAGVPDRSYGRRGTMPGNEDVARQREIQQQIQELSKQHSQSMVTESQEFQRRMLAARTPNERRRIQEDFRQRQLESQQRLQQEIQRLRAEP